MSHKEEQIQEVEALESIFGEEIESLYSFLPIYFRLFTANYIFLFFYSN